MGISGLIRKYVFCGTGSCVKPDSNPDEGSRGRQVTN